MPKQTYRAVVEFQDFIAQDMAIPTDSGAEDEDLYRRLDQFVKQTQIHSGGLSGAAEDGALGNVVQQLDKQIGDGLKLSDIQHNGSVRNSYGGRVVTGIELMS